MHSWCVLVQRQALQDFRPRMEQLQQQYKEQQAVVRAATQAVRTAEQALETGRADIADLEAEKLSLQQSAEETQQQMASGSEVSGTVGVGCGMPRNAQSFGDQAASPEQIVVHNLRLGEVGWTSRISRHCTVSCMVGPAKLGTRGSPLIYRNALVHLLTQDEHAQLYAALL